MPTTNITALPRTYLPFRSRDSTLVPRHEVSKAWTTQIEGTIVHVESVVDSFHNDRLEESRIFSIRPPVPISRWHPALKGTTAKFLGRLSKIFPEFDKIDDGTLDRLIKEIRDREE